MAGSDATKLDRFGRVLIPKPLRDALGLRAGDELSVEELDGGLLLRPTLDAAVFEVREGVVVYEGRAAGDLREAVRRSREERMAGLGGAVRDEPVER